MRQKPDFICIGPTKTATDWLYSRLRQFPGVDIPVKEMYYFWGLEKETHAELNYQKIIRDVLHAQRKKYVRDFKKRYNHLSFRTLHNLGWDLNFLFAPRTPMWYTHLFQKGKISGDMNAMFYLLRENQIRQLRDHLPDLKIIIHLRDPVERVWSNVNMVINLAGQKTRPVSYTLEQLRRAIDWNMHSLPSYVDFIARWKTYFPEEQIQTTYFDEIQIHPDIVLARTAVFLGLEISDFTGSEQDVLNREHVTYKAEMPDEIRRYLVGQYYHDVERLSKISDSPYPAGWLVRYRPYFSETELYTAQQSPSMSPERTQKNHG